VGTKERMCERQRKRATETAERGKAKDLISAGN
jgi:hypothetical protein